jgi:DNA polymerase III subunit epsilon
MYASFDLETTGTNFVLHEICEIAIVNYDKDFKKIKEFRTLLKTHNPITDDVIAIHGITNEMVADKPYFSEVAPTVLALLEGQILCGQNIRDFDIPFLGEKLFQCNIPFDANNYKTLDTLKIETIVSPRNLGFLYKKYTGKDLDGAHSALVDVEACMEVLKAQIETHNLDINSEDFNEMFGIKDKFVDPTKKLVYIDGVVCWNIGKHKGKSVTEDKGYANWCLGADFPESTKFYIKRELDKVK